MNTDQVIGWTEAFGPFDVRPSWAGVPPSEMTAALAIIHGMGITHVVESGRYDGTSTEAFALAGLEVDSIECTPRKVADRRFNGMQSVRLHHGSGSDLVPELATADSAVLVDGPKQLRALEIAGACKARVVFIHDVHCGSRARKAALGWFTDDEDWVEYSKHLDAEYWRLVRRDGTAWKRGPYSAGGGSYGPTLVAIT